MSPAALLLAVMASSTVELAEPTVEDLLAIEAEAPVLAAELAVVDAEIEFLNRPSVDSRRHLRRTQHALARVIAVHVNHPCIGALS